MSLENAKKFLEELEGNKELADKCNAMSQEERQKVAEERGFTLDELKGSSLSDDELDSVSGGTIKWSRT